MASDRDAAQRLIEAASAGRTMDVTLVETIGGPALAFEIDGDAFLAYVVKDEGSEL